MMDQNKLIKVKGKIVEESRERGRVSTSSIGIRRTTRSITDAAPSGD